MKSAFVPTAEQRETVEMLASVETRAAVIASVLGIKLATLRQYFADELEHGPARIRARMESVVLRHFDAVTVH